MMCRATSHLSMATDGWWVRICHWTVHFKQPLRTPRSWNSLPSALGPLPPACWITAAWPRAYIVKIHLLIDFAHMTSATPRPYQICSRCVMDTSDPLIALDGDGICEYCKNFSQEILP